MIFHVSDVRKRVERLCSGQFIMNFIKRCSCYATDLILSGWFALCIFQTSESLHEDNDVKWYTTQVGGLVLLICVALFVKDVRHFAIKHIARKRFFAIIWGLGILVAIHGILQFFHLFPSNHSAFPVTGPYENPAGITSVLALTFPIGVYFFLNSIGWKKVFIGLLIVLVIVAISLAGARAAMLAVLLSTTTMLTMRTSLRQWFLQHRIVLYIVIGFCIVGGIYLFLWKSESVFGRLYIWGIALSLVPKHPICGFGPNGFKSHYMLQQADYFEHFPHSQYAEIADNISHPFNEYIHIMINWGHLGLLLFAGFLALLVIQAYRQRQWYSTVVVAVIQALSVLCMFSYPLRYAAVWIILIAVAIQPWLQYLPLKVKSLPRIAMVTLCFCLLRILYMDVVAEINWKRTSDRALMGYSEQMLPYFKRLYNTTYLSGNPYFLYNYAAELNYSGQYRGSIVMLNNCKEYLYDYDVALLMADNYAELHMPDSALWYAQQTSRMIPCRFLPLDYMLNAYVEKGDSAQAKKNAKIILSKPVKVNSIMVEEIRKKAEIIVSSDI